MSALLLSLTLIAHAHVDHYDNLTKRRGEHGLHAFPSMATAGFIVTCVEKLQREVVRLGRVDEMESDPAGMMWVCACTLDELRTDYTYRQFKELQKSPELETSGQWAGYVCSQRFLELKMDNAQKQQ